MVMNEIARYLAPAAIIAVWVFGTTAACAQEADAVDNRNAYVIRPVVSDVAGQAAMQDRVLQNAWGVAFTPAGSPFWVNDNVTGCSTLYAGDGTIDVFGPTGSNGLFTPATTDGKFTDPEIPAGYAPFGIQNIDGDLFVTYAQQNAQKHDDVAGAGHGFVDVFDTDGHLLRRFASGGPLNSPWGVARASYAFGRFSGDILVGNFGNGRINVFDERGRFIDELHGADGKGLIDEAPA